MTTHIRFLRTILVGAMLAFLAVLLPMSTPRAEAQQPKATPTVATNRQAMPLSQANPPIQTTDTLARLSNTTPPTVALTPAQGYSGQQVTVSGQATPGTPGVRVVWRYGDATRSAQVVTPNASGQYQAEVSVPQDAAQGKAQVCAAVTGSESATFGCANFTVQVAPPGTVEGRLPAGVVHTPGDAQFVLLDRAGALVLETPIAPDGSFRLENVAPGIYKTAIVGSVSPTVDPEDVIVYPARTTAVSIKTLSATGLGGCSNSITVTGQLSPSDKQSSPDELGAVGLATFPPPTGTPPSSYDFGVYIVGVTLNGALTAQTQGGSSSEKAPTFKFTGPNGEVGPYGSMNAAGAHTWNVGMNLGDSTIATSGTWNLHINPQDSHNTVYCESVKQIRFIADPMNDPKVFQPGSSKTTWNDQSKVYTFDGWLPNFAKLLPLEFPTDPWKLPLLGDASNEFDAGLHLVGSMTLDHTMTFTAFNAEAEAKILGLKVLNKEWHPDKMPSGLSFNPDDLSALAVTFPSISLWEKDWSTQVFDGVVATYMDIVTVKASVSVGLHGAVLMSITVYPLVPAMDVALTPTITPSLTVRIWVELLLGVASAGADATTSVSVSLPFHMKRDFLKPLDSPSVWFDNPCIGVEVDLAVWARINLGFYKKKWNMEPKTLVQDYRCGNNPNPNPPPPAPKTPPKLMGMPSIAASPDGGMLVVFVGDDTPNTQSPTPRVYALYKAPGQTNWPDPSQAVPLTDGTQMVQDPVATFAFPGKATSAFVFWTQTVISPSDEDAAGNDVKKILDHQEIFMSGSGAPQQKKWSSPRPITNDGVSDGRPAVSGDDLGFTLAWVRAKSSPYDRSQTYIAVMNVDAMGVGQMRTLPDTDGGMHAQPSVARVHLVDDKGDRDVRYVAYTTHADDLTSTTRRIRVWLQNGKQRDPDFSDYTGSGLPNGAMSPVVGVDALGNPMLAYLLNTQTTAPNATADSSAYLYFAWTGAYYPPSWSPIQVPGQDYKSPVRAEKPSFAWRPGDNNVYLFFRELGDAGTDASVGIIWGKNITFLQSGPPMVGSNYVPTQKGANWLPSTAQNQQTGDLEICWLQQASSAAEEALLAQLRPSSPAARVAAPVVTLNTSVETLKMATIPNKADPSLDPVLLLNPPHAALGATVTITTTVRNLGLQPVSGLSVSLYRDGTLIGTRALTSTFQPGDSVPVAWDVVAGRGQQSYSAVVTSGDSDMGTQNNRATGVLNALEKPLITSIARSSRFANALEIYWQSESHVNSAGYRILRATAIQGPYELVGEATGVAFADLGLAPSTDYFYKVQAFDLEGVLSEASAPSKAPQVVYRTSLTASDGTYTDYVRVSWSASPNATAYKVYRNTTNDPNTATLIATLNSIMRYDDTTAVPGVTYYYWVKAVTAQGETAFSPSDTGSHAANWQSEAVNWRVDYGRNWTRVANITKPGATNIRVHFSQIALGAGDGLSTSTGDNWTGNLSDVFSRATVDRNSISVALFSGANSSGYFVIDRIEFQGTSAGPATWAGDLTTGANAPTRTPTPTIPIPPGLTPTYLPTFIVPPSLTPTRTPTPWVTLTFTPPVPPGGQLQPSRTPTVRPATASPGAVILIEAKKFTSANLKVARGTQVMWMNTDKINYSIVSGTPARRTNVFNSGILLPGQSFKFTFQTPGIYSYFDETLGAQMQGTITVQ